jgi:four helix bundle protein
MSECSDKIPSNIGEGFGQGSDAHCAHYQPIARGSANEMCAHLCRARRKRLISDEERRRWSGEYETIGKMLTQWIKHLEQENRPRRGYDVANDSRPTTVDQRQSTDDNRPTTPNNERLTTND